VVLIQGLSQRLGAVRWGWILQWWLVFLAAMAPFALLLNSALNNQLGADPAKTIVDELGTWAMNFLWITLAITPARRVIGWRKPLLFRRMMGLYAFFYAVLHLLAVATFILGWRADLIVREVSERPYVIAGFAAFLLLIPLAVTSTRGWQARLGRRWRTLHLLVFPAALLVLLHFVWLIRASYAEATFYTILLAFLLGIRLYIRGRRRY